MSNVDWHRSDEPVRWPELAEKRDDVCDALAPYIYGIGYTGKGSTIMATKCCQVGKAQSCEHIYTVISNVPNRPGVFLLCWGQAAVWFTQNLGVMKPLE